ncbi:MAG TPA: transporter [Sphingobium sp.]|uniref:SphA family protein n=1 Tax=Sphingobium sp. TaxID=1912891 RepID=UPI002ED4F249
MLRRWSIPTRFCAGMASGLIALCASPAFADENGASIYLLGSGGPSAAVLPPLKGIYFGNSVYVYDASSNSQRNFNLGGNLVANVDTTLVANFTSVLWVPSTNVLGGTLAVGALLPVGAPIVDAAAFLTGPAGRQVGVSVHDSALVVGDPLVTAEMGWKSGKIHVAFSGLLNIPVGEYREHQLANLSFHRWAGDLSTAVSWHDEESGWDVSGKIGLTINGKNDFTDYNSGNDLHFEASVEKTLSKQFSLGVQGYHFEQISDDSGSGARLGAYRGRITGLGGTVAYSTILGRSPSTFRLQVFQEFGAENRMEGTAFMLSLSLPLHMKMPPQAAQ